MFVKAINVCYVSRLGKNAAIKFLCLRPATPRSRPICCTKHIYSR